MSITITFTGNKSKLETNFNPPLHIDNEYECGLLFFSALNSIPNVNNNRNVFIYGDNKLILPCGTYDLYDINEYLNDNMKNAYIQLIPNNNTLTCSLYCSETVNFDADSSIGPLLGFSNTLLEANKWHESPNQVNIQPVSVIRVECDLVQGSYINGLPSHIIHEFTPNIPPGYRYIEVPKKVIYFPVNKINISSINIKILDENGKCIDFRKENILVRIHLRKSKRE